MHEPTAGGPPQARAGRLAVQRLAEILGHLPECPSTDAVPVARSGWR
ncbi:hypothetical protein [Actinomadura sp. 6K520]|nr:hypothetical protein [Actinomadura sp. 6K520]